MPQAGGGAVPITPKNGVEHDVDVAVLGKIVRQSARERTHGVVAPVVEHVDRLDVDLEHLARFCALDRDGSG
jgi:hypothetical protein